MHLKSWHFNGGIQVTDKFIGSLKSWNFAVASSVLMLFYFSNIFAINTNVIFQKKNMIQTRHVRYETNKVCLISSIKLPRNQGLQHRRVISMYLLYIISLWVNIKCNECTETEYFTSFRRVIQFFGMLSSMVMSVLLYLFTLLTRGILCYMKMNGKSKNQNSKIVSNGGLKYAKW